MTKTTVRETRLRYDDEGRVVESVTTETATEREDCALSHVCTLPHYPQTYTYPNVYPNVYPNAYPAIWSGGSVTKVDPDTCYTIY